MFPKSHRVDPAFVPKPEKALKDKQRRVSTNPRPKRVHVTSGPYQVRQARIGFWCQLMQESYRDYKGALLLYNCLHL